MIERYTLENIKKVFEKPGYVGWEVQRVLFDLKHRGAAIDGMCLPRGLDGWHSVSP